MKKKLLLLLMAVACSTLQSLAQSSWENVAKVTNVLVWNVDSTFTAFKCADQPVVRPDATGLIIEVNGTQITFPLNEARKFTFATDEQVAAGIENPVNNGTYEITQNGISVEDLKDGTVIAIYDISGKTVARKQAVGGSASIDTSSLPHGVYVVKAGNINFKFMKR